LANIISCSRRTDIPAFYAAWFINRLRAGYCHTVNPFGGQLYRISLLPEDVIALTFWTRNPAPLYPHLDEMEERGYPFFFSMTITGYPRTFEPHSPPLESALRTFRQFSDRLSPLRMRWRYDPILISSDTPAEYHLRRFEEISATLEGYTSHCTFSFVQFYGKTTRNAGEAARKAGIRLERPDLEAQRSLAQQLAGIAAARGISFNTCCNDPLIGDGVTKSRCIDPALVRAIAAEKAGEIKLKPTRPDCGCAASLDIGIYDTCRFDCVYCYATSQPATALRRHAEHDPQDSILWRPEALRGKDLNG
jgi:hypothetical protein